MFDKRHISAEHPDRKYKHKLKFIRDAADGDLDKGKWSMIGKQPSKSKATTGKTDHYLIRFEKESEHSFQESLILAHSFQYTKVILDSYLALFAGVKKTITWQNTSKEAQDYYNENFDGEGTGVQDWLSDWFCEAMITARTPIITASPAEVEYPYASLLPRENMRNWHVSGGVFNFLTFDSTYTKVSGINIEQKPSIWVMTPEKVGEYDPGNGCAAFLEAGNVLNVVPAVDVWFFGGKSILGALASLDLNLMNLDREMRKVIRNQAGMNFFVTDESVDLSKLSERTWIKQPAGADRVKPFWANYEAGSLGDAFTYGGGLVRSIYEISRLRRQKDDVAESGIAKTIDFTNTKAVLNHISNTMEQAFPKVIELMAGYEGNNMTAELKISREFDTTSAEAEIDRLLKELSAGMGQTVDSHLKKQYRDKYTQIPENLKPQSDAEIENYEANKLKAMTDALTDNEPSHDHENEEQEKK